MIRRLKESDAFSFDEFEEKILDMEEEKLNGISAGNGGKSFKPSLMRTASASCMPNPIIQRWGTNSGKRIRT